MNTTALAPGENAYVDMHSPTGSLVLHVRIDRHHDNSVAVTVVVPIETDLNRHFPTAAEADAYIAFLRSEVANGTRVYDLEIAAGVLTSASAALDRIDLATIAGVNATMDEAHAEREAEVQKQVAAEQAAVADIVNGPRTWNAYRQAVTRSGRPTSEPMDRILGSATADGYIPRGRNASSTQLVALERRGKVELDWQHGRIAGAWLAGRKPGQVAA